MLSLLMAHLLEQHLLENVNDDKIYGGIAGAIDVHDLTYGTEDTVSYSTSINGVTVDFVNNIATGDFIYLSRWFSCILNESILSCSF